MEARLQSLRDFAQQRQFKQYRTYCHHDKRHEYKQKNFDFSRRSAEILKYMCDAETPVIKFNEQIGFARSKINVPYYFEDHLLREEFEQPEGVIFDVFHNLTPNYEILLNKGLKERLEFCDDKLETETDEKKKAFYENVIISIKAVLDLAEKYALAEEEAGNYTAAGLFRRVPLYPAATFHEALQSLRFVSACFYLGDCYQIGFGRMDQYLYPFYKKDIASGLITRKDAYNLLCEFFISLNKDSDLYRGVQQGDNGQTVMLGGCKADGSSAVNDLTYLIMEVSRDLRLIDPKINLRIDSSTPLDLLELGCELTSRGLGFPQYSNDEVVIPALVKKGYSLEDAREYSVAACWEFVIPGKAVDIVNQGAVSFPYAVDKAFEEQLQNEDFDLDAFRQSIYENMRLQLKNIVEKRRVFTLPSPFMSIFMDGALEEGVDASVSAKYHNIGVHGAGSANAADAVCAIKNVYREEGMEGLKMLSKMKNANFPVKSYYDNLRDEMPKTGNNEEESNKELKELFDLFATAAEELSTEEMSIRPGTGSAMYYVWLTEDRPKPWMIEPVVGATADGSRKGSPLSSSLAPAHGIKVNGILSVFQSFSHIDYERIMNGGPITVELSPSVFTSEEGIAKLAKLIKYFVSLGNQQLQLNVIDVATLQDALENPENHKNLIVRVWGWSGYFCELAPEFQQHIIHRHQYCNV